MNEEEKTVETYNKIMTVLIKEAPTEEYGKFITYSGLHLDGHFIRIDVIGDKEYRKEIKERLKDSFDIECKDGPGMGWSRKFRNKNSNTNEKMRIVVFPDQVEIGIYTGKYYDCEVICENKRLAGN
ncbi:hypothetical protein FACS1894200_00130 [Spirochaetia bacterium]|nr:hypothetical protein FACS1894200_00130 [Spirochaetia bacterium]